MAEVLASHETAVALVNSALAAFNPSAEAPAATTSGFELNGRTYKINFGGASESSAAGPDEIPPAPEIPPIPGADEYEQACTQEAIEPPRKMLFTRQGRNGIDEFAEETSWLPTVNAMFNPVKVDGKLCDPAVVERITTGTILLGGKVPESIKFDGFWTSNGNRRITVNVGLLNDFLDKICRKALRREGEDKGLVRMTLAALTLADTNGKIEQTDPYAVYTYGTSARCKEPKKVNP